MNHELVFATLIVILAIWAMLVAFGYFVKSSPQYLVPFFVVGVVLLLASAPLSQQPDQSIVVNDDGSVTFTDQNVSVKVDIETETILYEKPN